MHETVFSPDAPGAVGPYCHGTVAGNTMYTSGQLGLVPQSGVLAQGIEAQTRQALTNLGHVLRGGGMDFCHVVKTLVFLTSMEDFAAVNEIYGEFFSENPPARSCVAVAALPKGALFEIEAIAVK